METQEFKGVANKEELEALITKWIDYATQNLTNVYMESARLEDVRRRMVEAGYADEDSIREGNQITEYFAKEYVAEDQRQAIEQNKQRLLKLSRLAGKSPKELAGTTIVSIGGGPGDMICEPWFPRLAAVTGAHVINFDYSPAHPLDQEMHLYDHRGGSEGDILKLLLNKATIRESLASTKDISIIECNNLIGANISPSLAMIIGVSPDNVDHPAIVEMRRNLLSAAQDLLSEGGVLAIDDWYWVKKSTGLVSVEV